MFSMRHPNRMRVVKRTANGRTKQEFRDECDLNILMKKYEKFGTLPPGRQHVPQFMDASDVPDFHSAMQMMVDAERSFMTLPATVRKRFGNDAASFVEFATDPSNIDQMREWGLAAPLEGAPEPVLVRVQADTPSVEAPASAGVSAAPKAP